MADACAVLHLSDLHFGPKSRIQATAEQHREWGRRLGLAVTDVAAGREFGSLERMVVVTGDVSESAVPSQYELAAAATWAFASPGRCPKLLKT